MNVISCPGISAKARNNASGTLIPLPEDTKASAAAL